jgi:hypothetical protein
MDIRVLANGQAGIDHGIGARAHSILRSLKAPFLAINRHIYLALQMFYTLRRCGWRVGLGSGNKAGYAGFQ